MGPEPRKVQHLDSLRLRHHDLSRRTTLTLEDELVLELKRIARQTDRSFKAVVNTTLRRGLFQGGKSEAPLPPSGPVWAATGSIS